MAMAGFFINLNGCRFTGQTTKRIKKFSKTTTTYFLKLLTSMKYTLQVSKAHTIYINMFYIFFSKKENFILYQTMKENCNLPSTFLKCD